MPVPASAQLRQLITSHFLPRCLQVVAELGVADHLGDAGFAVANHNPRGTVALSPALYARSLDRPRHDAVPPCHKGAPSLRCFL